MLGFFGPISPPPGVVEYGSDIKGLMGFANNILKLLIIGGGVFAFVNVILAGYGFLGAGGDAKKVEQAWAKIWQSLIGLIFIGGSLVLAAIFGWLIFKDVTAILNPKVYGPGN